MIIDKPTSLNVMPLKKTHNLTAEKQKQISKSLVRSFDFIRDIAKEVVDGQSLIRKSLAGYSQDEIGVIYIILESISETPIPFSGPYRGLMHVFRVWYFTDNELVILTNPMEASPVVTAIDLASWFEGFL